ncbi:MAG: carboxypeptidase regulatory-like domain-containing protein, partial [Thermoplasmata archaeon]
MGSPAFALLSAEAIRRALDVGGYPELRRTVASLSDRRSQAAAFRKAFKARHVLVMLLVLVIVLPNLWVAVDAGIPGNTKTELSAQVYDSLPAYLKGNSSTAGNYFGAAGSAIETSNQYDSAGYNWLAQQDVNAPEPQRPAFVSWWDYGFQAIDQGAHPSVADNFQNGIDPAGQFLLAQNESNAIAVLTTTLLQAEQSATGLPYLPAALNTILRNDGVNVTELHSLMVNESTAVTLVVNNPARYLPVNPNTLTADNAMYMAVSYLLATSATLPGVASLYNAVQGYTGWSIRYDLTDSRLIPFSGQNTGIFYAPADLTGRQINSAGLPSTYFNVTVLGSDGNYYPLGGVPANVQAVNYYVNYFAPFFNSMIYRTYFGYNGTDIGLFGGIPGLEGAAGAEPVEPGWMLQHFEVVYKTAYYCHSNTSYNINPGCYVAVNTPRAVSLARTTGGTANTSAGLYFSGGESMLEYYPGQTLLGDVQLPGGKAVSGVRVTVFDQWGIPHMSVVTAPDGSFSVVLPPGNDTLNITTGTLAGLSQQGATVLDSVNISVPDAVGFSLTAPSVQRTFVLGAGSAFGFTYWNVANSTAYIPASDPLVAGAEVVLWGPGNVSTFTTTTDASGAFQMSNLPPATYNSNVIYNGYNYSVKPITVLPSPAAPTNATAGIVAGSVKGLVFSASGGAVAGAFVTLGDTSGVLRTNTTNATGAYEIAAYAPGNYTLTASVPGTSERSVGVRLPYIAPAGNFTENLTLATTSPVSVTVVAGGAPAVNIPVQFTPIAAYLNATLSPLADLSAAGGNGTSVLTDANGRVSLALPLGNYSVTALGYVGSSLYAGIGSISSSTLTPGASLQLTLGPAVRLSGSVSSAGPAGTASATAVIAYAADGSPAYTWAAQGAYTFYLPAGTYSVLAIQGTMNESGTVYAALSSVALGYPTTLNLRPSVAIAARFSVGSVLPDHALYPAGGARVSIAAGSNGPTVNTIASINGTLVAYVPAALSTPATSFCVAAGSAGFVSAAQCGISPNGLATMTRFPLSLTSVSVSVRAPGVPSGSTITVNLTALSATAVNQTLSGGPTWSLDLPPGNYAVSGWAPTGNSTTLYLPSTSRVNETVPFGASGAVLSLPLLLQTRSTGTITVPSGGLLSNTTVTLSSASFNASVNGTRFESGFFAPTGTYSGFGNVRVGATTYSALLPVTIAAGGAVSPSLSLAHPGYNVTGELTRPAGGTLSA